MPRTWKSIYDKGMVYGALLVDDWPEYVEVCLMHRARGLVIMPANGHNVGYSHPNVIRYDGSDLEAVRRRMQERFNAAQYQCYRKAELHRILRIIQDE